MNPRLCEDGGCHILTGDKARSGETLLLLIQNSAAKVAQLAKC